MSLEQYSKATQETAQNLRIIDDALFRLMAERPGVCQEILRTLLDMPKLVVTRVTAQSVVKSLHREITLDAFCVLENGEYANVEMQKGACNDDIARTRFHAAALTTAYTPKGTDFRDIPQVTILYITEYDALNNNQAVTHVKRCMQTNEGFIPVSDKEDIIFANTAVKDDSDKSKLLQLFLRKDVFEDEKYPELSKAMRYFKQTEGGRSEVCKTVDDYAISYAKNYAISYGQQCRAEERLDSIRNMIEFGLTKEQILRKYSEEEYEKAEQSMLTNA